MRCRSCSAHDVGPAYPAADDRLIDDSPQARPVLAGQDALAFHADLNAALDVLAVQFPRASPGHLPGVLLGLQQAGHHGGFEVADGRRSCFQADEDLVGVGQDVAEGVPPAGLAGFTGSAGSGRHVRAR